MSRIFPRRLEPGAARSQPGSRNTPEIEKTGPRLRHHIATQDFVKLFGGQRPGIGQPFDFLCDLTQLGVTKMKPKLLRPALNCILPGETMGDGDRPLQSKICRINDFISSRIEHDGFRMHPGLMRKTGLTRNVIVEGNLDTDNVRHHFIQIVEHIEFVFLHKILVVGIETGNQATQRSNPIPFANAQDACVNVRCTGLQRGKTVGNGATAVIMSMKLDAGF